MLKIILGGFKVNKNIFNKTMSETSSEVNLICWEDGLVHFKKFAMCI